MLGPSGCGKTTTLRSIAGLETPTSGDIFIGERNVTWLEPKERDVAMVFESYALYPHMTVAQNIGYPLKIRGMSKPDIEKSVMEVAKMLQMESVLDRFPKQLSGGQRQRVAIGRAIVRKPAVYLMDEPISHLDAKLRAHMRGELKRLQKDLGRTTIYVTHDQLEAMAMADRVAVMRLGVLQQASTPDELYNNPVNMYVAGFIGDPPINFLTGRLGACGGGEETSLIGADFTVPLSAGLVNIINTHKHGGEIVVGMRPEHMAVHKEKPEAPSIEAEVYVSEPLGAEVIVNALVGKQIAKIRTPSGTKVDVGQPIWLTFEESFVQIFDKETEESLRINNNHS
jgi:multiple sugar transport system ATP-binding protein